MAKEGDESSSCRDSHADAFKETLSSFFPLNLSRPVWVNGKHPVCSSCVCVLQTVNRQEECFALLTWAQFTEVTIVPLNSAEVSEMYISIKATCSHSPKQHSVLYTLISYNFQATDKRYVVKGMNENLALNTYLSIITTSCILFMSVTHNLQISFVFTPWTVQFVLVAVILSIDSFTAIVKQTNWHSL